jgi:hypothetical protein
MRTLGSPAFSILAREKIIEQTSGIYLPPSGDTMPTQPFCIDYAMFPC